MKNKTTTYILIAGVILIWGLVFYNIFTGLNASAETSYATPSLKVVRRAEVKEKEAYFLYNNYRDPFLGTTTQTQSNSEVVKPFSKVKKEIKPKVVIDWSFIDYIGIVYNKDTQKKVGLLNISGKDYMVNDGDVVGGVTVLRKERDSVEVGFGGERKWVRR